MIYIFFIFFIATLTPIIKIHGDTKIPYPNFPRQAQFIIESIIIDGQHERTLVECIYDYDKNRLVVISEDVFQYYDYTTLKKAIYSKHTLQKCDVYPIDIDNPFDGFSAVTNSNDNTTHIRPLYDFLLLTSDAIYSSETIVRGHLHVDQWISSISNDSEIIWSFAKSDYNMPWNASNYAIPIQRIIKRKDDETIVEVLNIFSYKSTIVKNDLTPPKGIFCNQLIAKEQLLSLQDINMKFPDKFSVRIDVSTTNQQLWRSVHLHYRLSRERTLIRYDYTPFDNTQNPLTIIIDSGMEAWRSYTIDQRTGLCTISQTTDQMLSTSVINNPIETLIKFQDTFLFNSSQQIFQYTGTRSCRGSILCTIYVGQISEFPPDRDDNWVATNIEWAWSKRNIDDDNALYDYPVYLNLNFYRNFNEPATNIHYEFYDYRTEVHLNEFDVNLCYRSNQLWYQHLAFQLTVRNRTTSDDLENISINRRRLSEYIRAQMMDIMSIKYLRISQLELDHHPKELGHNDTLYCIFTLLDRTPFIDPNAEVELLDAKNQLENSINQGEFRFETDDDLSIEAVPGSLEEVQYFYAFNPDVNVNQIDYFFNTTVHVNRTIEETIEEISEQIQYSDGAQAGAIIGGMIVGIICGTVTILIIVFVMKRKLNRSRSGTLTFRNISFRIGFNRKQDDADAVDMEHPIDSTRESRS